MGIIKRQGIKNAIITYVGIAIGLVNILFIQPRFLSTEEIGLTRLLFNLSSIVAFLMPLGIGVITVKYFPYFHNEKNGHNGFFGLILLFMSVGFVVVTILLLMFKGVVFTQYEKESKLFTDFYYCVFPLSLILAFNAVLTLYCNSIFKTTIPALLNEILIRVIAISLFSIYFLKWISLSIFVMLFVGIYGVQVILLLSYIIKVGHPSLKINWGLFKQHHPRRIISYGLLLTFSAVAALGIKFLDSLVIGHYYNLSYVGIYTIAAFIPTVLEAPLNALERITNTKIAHALAAYDYAELKKVYYQSVKYLLIIGGLLFVGIVTNIEFLLKFLPGTYEQGLGVVYIISLGTLCNIAGGSNTSIILNSHNYKKGAALMIILVFVTFVLNILLIPKFGINGAATATAFSTGLYSILKFGIIYREFKLQPYTLSTLKIFTLIIVCLTLNCFLPKFSSPILNIIFRTGLFTLTYLLGIIFLRIEVDLFKKIFSFNFKQLMP